MKTQSFGEVVNVLHTVQVKDAEMFLLYISQTLHIHTLFRCASGQTDFFIC